MLFSKSFYSHTRFRFFYTLSSVNNAGAFLRTKQKTTAGGGGWRDLFGV